MFNILKKIHIKEWHLGIFIALLFIVIFFLIYQWINLTKKIADKDSVIYNKEIELQTLSKRWMSETGEQRLTIEELKALAEKDKKTIGQLLRRIEDMKLKLKNLESLGTQTLVVRDTFYITPYFDTLDMNVVQKESYSDGFLNLYREYDYGYGISKYIYDYSDTLTWAISRYHLEKWKLKNLFVKRKWHYKLTASWCNPKAHITYNQYFLNTERKKRK